MLLTQNAKFTFCLDFINPAGGITPLCPQLHAGPLFILNILRVLLNIIRSKSRKLIRAKFASYWDPVKSVACAQHLPLESICKYLQHFPMVLRRVRAALSSPNTQTVQVYAGVNIQDISVDDQVHLVGPAAVWSLHEGHPCYKLSLHGTGTQTSACTINQRICQFKPAVTTEHGVAADDSLHRLDKRVWLTERVTG